MHAVRVAAVREALSQRRLDGLLIQHRPDQIWLTGFTGEDGAVLVTARQVVLLTDSRFDETADLEAPWAVKVLRKRRGPETTAKEIKKRKLARIGFEPRHMDVFTHSSLVKLLKPSRLVAASGVVGTLRRAKCAEEVAAIRRAIDVAERAFEVLRGELRPGQTEREAAARLVYELQRHGAQEPAFGPIVAAGPNGSIPHYTPGDRALASGDLLLLDWGARVDGYISDLTRVIALGSIPPQLREVHSIVREAHDAAIAGVRAGVKAATVDKLARDVIRKRGYDKQFGHALGHGIGLEVHEAPRLGRESDDRLEVGMVVTIEPGIYLPGVGGVRLEDDVLVTATGAQVLSSLPLELSIDL